MRRAIHTVAVVAALLVAGCGEQTTVPSQRDPLAQLSVDQVLFSMNHVMTREGVRKAILNADTALFRDNDSEVDLKRVKLQFFNETTGLLSGTLNSAAGVYDRENGSMRATGDAVLVLEGPSGKRTITSETLNYDLQADRVWSDEATVMREGANVLRGTSFESDTKFQKLTVHNAAGSSPRGGGQVRF